MEIKAVDSIPIEMKVKPFDEPGGLAPYVSSNRGRNIDTSEHYEVDTRKRVLIRLETEAGIVGWGEMLPVLKSPKVASNIINDVIEPILQGRSVADVGDFVNSIYFPYLKIRPILGGVTMAMLDAHGKTVGAPIYELLGGKKIETVPFAYCVGILNQKESREKIREAKKMGFDVVKTKAGNDWKADLARIQAMDDAANGEIDLRVDPNQAYSTGDAVRFLAGLEDSEIYLQYYEQPIKTDNFESMNSLRQRTKTPIAANEDAYFEGNIHHLLQQSAIDVAVMDLVPAGGIHEVRSLAQSCKRSGVSVAHHSSFDLGIKTAAVLHTYAATPEIDLPPDTVYYAWEDSILETPFEFENGAIEVPQGNGLGITVAEEKIDQYRID